MNQIEKFLGYEFKNKDLLVQALTHSSYTNEHKKTQNYERLEFLGDSIVGFVVSFYLYKTFPTQNEGQLTLARKKLVNRDTLADIIDKNNLLSYMRFGSGEITTNSLASVKLKCDMFESLVGALWIDTKGNLQVIAKFILSQLQPYFGKVEEDFKSRLYEFCAKNKIKAHFEVVEVANDENNNKFTMELFVDGESKGTGSGYNKKSAEQQASKNFMLSL